MNISVLILLFISHYICDFTHLSTKTMLAAKSIGKPLLPIAAHSIVHSLGVLIVLSMFPYKDELILILTAAEFITHFLIDTLKGRLNVWYPPVANPSNKIHWYIFGLDQLLHNLVLILIWWLL